MLILKTALKYAFSGKSGQKTSNFMIIAALAVSIASVIVTAAVMNGLQSDQINLLRDTESFDLMVENSDISNSTLEELSEGKCFDMIETPVLLNESQAIRLRGLDSDLFDNKRFKQAVDFNSLPDDGISVSYNLLSTLNIRPGKEIEITLLKKGKAAILAPYSFNTFVKSVYSCDLAEYSENTIIMNIDEIRSLFSENDVKKCIYTNLNPDLVKDRINEFDPKAKITTWKEYNKAVYSALVLEKTLMYVFLLCIFLIIVVALRNSTKRLIDVKRTEGSILKAMGMQNNHVMKIFIIQAMIISISGMIIGTITGIIIQKNVNKLLRILSRVTYMGLFEINPEISLIEVFSINAVVLFLAFIFIFPASKQTYSQNVMEVLNHDCS